MSAILKRISVSAKIIATVVVLNITTLLLAVYHQDGWYYLLGILFFLLIVGFINISQTHHTILKNYPILGHIRYIIESIRPELRQYLWESDLDGKPFNRRQRSIVYQRAKNEKQTVAFGMQVNPSDPGYEWVAHSVFPVKIEKPLRVLVGNHQCMQPYDANILNIGAMSYGALSKTAVQSLNQGAAIEQFAHNTGEGGISDYHLMGGDLIWQIGTGYFGCRDEEGHFNPHLFQQNAARTQVKMIELKLSQGAKPGHGGILPAKKNTTEIAGIRNVVPHTTVYSPPGHSSFSNAIEMISFLGKLRELSGGKPIGFKICIGDKAEFLEICKAIEITGIVPDFISIDGAEGGTGAAPLEFTDHIGMPLYDALSFVTQSLQEFEIKNQVKLIASGRLITGFDILKVLSLGADLCYSARGMMLSLGCIQALQCDSGHCPAGIATQDKNLYKGLNVTDKRQRVANYHRNTMHALLEMMEACGFKSLEEIDANKFFRKIDPVTTKSFQEIYFKSKNESSLDSIFDTTRLN